jgi:hypothetical protein
MGFNLPPVNTGGLRAQLDTARAGYTSEERSQRIKVEKDQIIYFFILPPWNAQRGLYAKETIECFNLPPPPGKKFGIHTAWQTFESFEPGISAKDPIAKAIREARDMMGDKFPMKYLPSRKFNINVVLRSYGKLGPKQEILPGTYVQNETPKVGILSVTPPAFTKIANLLAAAMESPEGRADNPLAAICFCLSRIEKPGANQTSKTEYVVGVEGRNAAGRGLVPDRFNLTEMYKTETIEAIYAKITDLDMEHPVPSEGQRVAIEHWATVVRAEFSKLVSGGAPAQRSAPQRQPAPAAPPPPPPPQETSPQPPVEPASPPPSPPPPPFGLPGRKEIMTTDLGLDSPPRKEGNIPVCFAHIDEVSQSPNARWCASCAYRNACKAKSSVAKKA